MFEIQDEQLAINKYFEMEVFSIETKERIKTADIILLPEFNIIEGVNRVFQPDTINFYKYIQSNKNLDISIELFENKGEENILILHSIDIWIPTIAIINDVLYPTVINLVSNYVYDKIKGYLNKKAVVHFQLIIQNDKTGKSKKLSYKGPIEGFTEQFNKIDINKMWEE